MHTKLKQILGGAAVVTVAAVGLTFTPALAGPPLGVNTLTPGSGNSSTVFTLIPPANSSCTGSGSGTPAYRWQTFMVSAAVDASTLTYTSGPVPIAGQVVLPLYDAGGTPIVNKNPSASPLGLISSIPTMSFSAIPAGTIPAGDYKIGIACTQAGALDAGKFWEKTITIVPTATTALGGPAQFIYGQPAAAFAPTLGALTAGDQSLSGTLTDAGLSIPAVTGYTITATPLSAGVTPAPLTPSAAGAFAFSGLSNGVVYAVKATATNTVGTSVDSNTVNGTPTPLAYLPVTGLTITTGINQLTVAWTNPTDLASHPSQVPAGYDIVVTGSGSGTGTFNSASSPYVVTGLTAGVPYTITVQPKYTSPYTAPVASSSNNIANPPTLLYQDITVTRPVGQLVITQRCGVFAQRAAEAATATFPAVPLLPASANAVGTAPTTGAAAGGPADGLFNQYPYPVDSNGLSNAVYPTHCGINMGIGKLVTAGTYAGDYFAAYGQINQVTVVDTRDTDPGWTVTGTMSNFTKTGVSSGGTAVSGTQTFSGNFLGWSPVLTGDSGASLDGYDQTVTLPIGTVAPTNAAGSGLVQGKVMANAIPTKGLGIATLDAGVKLLIPLTAVNGIYSAVLTFSAV